LGPPALRGAGNQLPPSKSSEAGPGARLATDWAHAPVRAFRPLPVVRLGRRPVCWRATAPPSAARQLIELGPVASARPTGRPAACTDPPISLPAHTKAHSPRASRARSAHAADPFGRRTDTRSGMDLRLLGNRLTKP
jgi:hypothetical protein